MIDKPAYMAKRMAILRKKLSRDKIERLMLWCNEPSCFGTENL